MDKNVHDEGYYWVIGIFVVMAFLFGMVGLRTFMPNVEFNVSCDLQGIRTFNVSPSHCWNDKFSSDYCPIPESANCVLASKGVKLW